MLPYSFSVCHICDKAKVDWTQPFCFAAKTDREFSLVCLTEHVPKETLERADRWRPFRVVGMLDFL